VLHTRRNPHRLALAALALVLAVALAAPAADAAFPGKPGPLVYAHFESGPTWSNPAIFRHGPRLSQKPRPLSGARSSGTLAVSPDGRLIAFSTFNEDPANPTASHLFVARTDGGGTWQLTSGPYFDAHPAFSGDGGRVVFQRAVGTDPAFDLYSVALDGTDLRQLTSGPGNELEPTFTPGGGRILFVGESAGQPALAAIHSIAADGSDRRVVVDTPGNDSAPDVSPYGRRIVFASSGSILVARSNGSAPRVVARPGGSCGWGSCLTDPVWSPDGNHIAAFSSAGRGVMHTAVLVMRADGRRIRTFAEGNLDEVTGTRVGPPAWSPISP
jgi:Tol biopolymer transport system component